MPRGRGRPFFLGTEDGSGPEPYLGEELTGEHEIAEGGEDLTGARCTRRFGERWLSLRHRSIQKRTRGEMLEDCQYIAGSDDERGGLGNGKWVVRSKCVFVGGRRIQRSKGGSDSVEGIGRKEKRKSSLSNEIAVNELLQLFGGLHGGAGPTLP